MPSTDPVVRTYQRWRTDYGVDVDIFDRWWTTLSVNVGICLRCNSCDVPVCPPLAVVSKQFTGWVPVPVGNNGNTITGWCMPCSWAHWWKPLRTGSVAVVPGEGGGEVLWSPPRSAMRLLLSSSLNPNGYLTVPHRKAKHLLPAVQWGTITGDSGTFPWTEREAEIFRTVIRYRGDGVTGRQLRQLSPPPEFLVAALSTATYEEIVAEWDSVNGLRVHPLWETLLWVA